MFPGREDCVTRELLERNAARAPDAHVLLFDCDTRFTNAELLDEVRAYARGLRGLGVRPGDYVLTWLANGPLSVLMLLALNCIGAVNVPINTAYRGGLLRHVIASAGARLMVADGRLVDRLGRIDPVGLERVVVVGDERPALASVELLPDSVLKGDRNVREEPLPLVEPWDTQVVIFTSGTTGPSKGVLCSYMHIWTAACEFRHVGPGDRSLVVLPMHHVGGVLGVFFALVHGGSAVVMESFSTWTFWETVRRYEVTTVGLLGTMVQFLMQQPVAENEREHPVRTAVIAPFGDDALAFADRFGVDVFTEFNMTELSVPLFAGPNPVARGTYGRPRKGVELRLVDAQDLPVAAGQVGELVLRTDLPWSISHGYLNDPEATALAWRNGWFHTGDLFYADEQDNYFFVDRARDMIRRRGENISSFEVEAEIAAHADVGEVAVVAVPADGGEHDVLAVVAPRDGRGIEPVALLEFLRPRLAYFMLPRYFRFMDALPKTPTQKIEKHRLRAEGVTADTWDRERAGIRIRRDRLGRRTGAKES